MKKSLSQQKREYVMRGGQMKDFKPQSTSGDTAKCGKEFDTLCNLPKGHKGMCGFTGAADRLPGAEFLMSLYKKLDVLWRDRQPESEAEKILTEIKAALAALSGERRTK